MPAQLSPNLGRMLSCREKLPLCQVTGPLIPCATHCDGVFIVGEISLAAMLIEFGAHSTQLICFLT